jgi:hypothetical protein
MVPVVCWRPAYLKPPTCAVNQIRADACICDRNLSHIAGLGTARTVVRDGILPHIKKDQYLLVFPLKPLGLYEINCFSHQPVRSQGTCGHG